jgi:hypothetical protein
MKARKFRSAEQAKAHREAEAAWQELQKKYPARQFSAREKEKYGLPIQVSKVPPGRETPKYPSVHSQGYVQLGVSISKPRLSPEMQEREAKALVEVERKKKRLAIPYNKGPYMLLTPESDIATLGKK